MRRIPDNTYLDLTMHQALQQGRGPILALCLLLFIKFYWNLAMPIHACIVYDRFHDKKAEIAWLAKPKISCI